MLLQNYFFGIGKMLILRLKRLMVSILKFRILGKSWNLRVLSKKKYRKKHGKDSVAVTKGWKREVDLSPYGRDIETITHELVHCYLLEMCVGGSIESEDGLEEFFCELLSRRGEE